MAAPDLPIVLYHYTASPYARRIVWYLDLRKIPYYQCLQPVILPRPDLTEHLGISYRRIPLLSIGRDVYLDTRLILAKLEALFPPSAAHPPLSSAAPEHAALTALLSRLTTDGGLFTSATQLLPRDAGPFADPAFARDRAQLVGGKDSAFARAPPRPEAAGEVRDFAALLERTLLGDGRAWVLGTDGPALADIEAVWLLLWLEGLPGVLPPGVISKEKFPRVFAWTERFRRVVGECRGQPKSIDGAEAAAVIARAPFAEPEGEVDTADLVVEAEGLAKGVEVKLWPTDWGFSHQDAGKLVSIDSGETVIETRGKAGTVRVHAPRHGFRVRKASDAVPEASVL
ncbi:glutathione S-transferase [Whalleya microplaca]|nr:glutathione S-transferase [Whalleya microplaca]